jgi:hypothetical protein
MKDPDTEKDDTFGKIKAVMKGIGNSTKCTAMENTIQLKGLLPKDGLKMISLLDDFNHLFI